MNWEVIHSCGHIESHLIVADFAYVAETRARQLKRRKCNDCYRARKAAQADDQVITDEATLAGINLPALRGSDRQVAWAENIRRERLAAVVRKDLEAAKCLAGQEEAKWWIDHRTSDLAAILARNISVTS